MRRGHQRAPGDEQAWIKHLLKTYTQSPEYWSTLTFGTPRIDLAGNAAGEVTAADEEDAKRKIAKEPGEPRPRRSGTATRQASPRPNLLRNALDNKTRSQRPNLNS